MFLKKEQKIFIKHSHTLLFQKLLIKLGKIGDKSLRSFFLLCLGFYTQFLSVYLGGQCRFVPSCSVYARKSLLNKKISFFSSIKKIIFRILKCHPFSKGGWDPIEEEI